MLLLYLGLFLPASAFKAVRRAAAAEMLQLRQQQGLKSAEAVAEGRVLPQLLKEVTTRAAAAAVAAAAVGQAEAAMEAEVAAMAVTATSATNGSSSSSGAEGNTAAAAAAAGQAAAAGEATTERPPTAGTADSATSSNSSSSGVEGNAGSMTSSSSSSNNDNWDKGDGSRPISSSGTNNSSSSRSSSSSTSTAAPMLRVLCRSPQQVEAALKLPWLEEIVLDFLEVHGLKEAVAMVKSSGKRAVAALPRIFKPEEQRLLNFYLRLGVDALLLRSTGALQQLQQLGGPGAVVAGLTKFDQVKPASATAEGSDNHGSSGQGGEDVRIPALEGDFSLNAANVLSAGLLLGSGLRRLALTHDLNGRQLVELGEGLREVGRAEALEAIVHQHLPIFHTEHCVFCR